MTPIKAYLAIRRRNFMAQQLLDMEHQIFLNPANPAQKVFQAYKAFSNQEEAPEADLIREEEGKVAALSLLRESWQLLQRVIETMYDDAELQQRRMDSLWCIDVSTLSFELSDDANTVQMTELLIDVARDISYRRSNWFNPVTRANWKIKVNLVELMVIVYAITAISYVFFRRFDLLLAWAAGIVVFFCAVTLWNKLKELINHNNRE